MTTPGLLEIKKYRVQLYRYQINGETTDLSTCIEGSVSEWKAAWPSGLEFDSSARRCM